MGSGLGVGVTLPDADLEYLTGDPVKLSQAVGPRTFVSFFTPTCGACKTMLERIKTTSVSREDQYNFILISDVHPTEMLYLQDSLDIECRFLYDPEGTYRTRLGVSLFPFNLIVNQSMVIEEIMTGAPDEDDLVDLIKYNRR
jgi:peroxiredoxin